MNLTQRIRSGLHAWGRRGLFGSDADRNYEARLAQEKGNYSECLNVHQLPEIFHYWSHTYIRPKLEAFGFSSPNNMFMKYLGDQCRRDRDRPNIFVSIGAGNCDLEVEIAETLVSEGLCNFTLECVDLNNDMLKRGGELARQKNVLAHLKFVQADFNRWNPSAEYDAVMANQALHHVLNLEGLFDATQRSLRGDGLFVTSELIGRNGHMRWPEARAIVEEFWEELPASYRYNQQLQRQEDRFLDWDCSSEGFEGIRSQDILPLLVRMFDFQMFIGFANVIDPFVDRGFGHNFKRSPEDEGFIDRVHARDEQELAAGRIKPTHMLAVMTKEQLKPLSFHPPFTPQFCVRKP